MWLVYAIFSAIFAGLVGIVGKIGLKNIDSTLATTIRSIIMAIFLILISLIFKKFKGLPLNSFTSKDWIFIILAGIFGALSWLFYFYALKNGPATFVTAIDRLSIVFVFIMAAIFLDESFTVKSTAGLIFMVLGALLICIK